MTFQATAPTTLVLTGFSRLKTAALNGYQWVVSHSLVFLALACAVCCVVAFAMATRDKIVIGPFSVPREYEERGYSSEVVSNAVVQFIHGNESHVSLTQSVTTDASSSDGVEEMENISDHIDGQHVVSSFDQSNIPDVKVPFTSLSLDGLIEILRETIGRQPTRIAGEIVTLREETSSNSDPQRTQVLIRYKVEYPEPSHPVLGMRWWSRRTVTNTGTLSAYGAEEAVRKLALVTAAGLGTRPLPGEGNSSISRRLIARGNAYFGLNDYARAQRMFALANQKEESGHAYLSLGVIDEQLGDWTGAKENYERATRYMHTKHDDDAAWGLLYLGNLLMREKNIKEAKAKYLFITKETPDLHTFLVQAMAENNLGFVYLVEHKTKLAKAAFESAKNLSAFLHEQAQACAYDDICEGEHAELEHADNKAEAYLNIQLTNQLLARIHYGMAQTLSKGQTADNLSIAKRQYLDAIQANPAYSRAHYQLAHIYLAQSEYKKAIEQLHLTVQAEPGFEHAYTDWKDLVDLWDSHPALQKSFKPLKRTLASDYRTWGDIFSRAGNPDEAMERYCQAASLDASLQTLCHSQPGPSLLSQR